MGRGREDNEVDREEELDELEEEEEKERKEVGADVEEANVLLFNIVDNVSAYSVNLLW